MKQSTFSAVMANKLLTVLQGYTRGIRFVAVLMVLLTMGIGPAWGAEETATLSFANKAQRTSFSTTKQVWEQNGVTFTNDKASSSNAVADYAAPVRLYAGSSVTVACSLGNMTKIVFDCNSNSYATAMKNSIGNSATVSSDKVTVTLDGTSSSFTVAKLTAQIRLDAITVTYEEAVTEYNITYTDDDHITYSGTKPETIKKEDGEFELEFSVNDGYKLTNVQVKMGGQGLVVDEDYLWEEGYILIQPETGITGDIEIIFETVATCTNPTITTQPTGATYTKGATATALKVVADGDDLTYQWYSNTSNSTSGATKISDATSSTYTPSTSTVGTKYYYCIVSSGSCSTTSNIVSVVVKNPPFTVTLVPGSGSVTDTELTETSAGAGVTLPTPTLNGCDEWSFAGWKTTSAVTTETMTEPTLIPAGNYKPTANTTLYAVYQRTETTEGVETTTNTTDKLTRETTGVDDGSTTYSSWSDKTVTSSAVYAGNSAGSNNSIQLRSNNSNSGVITTTSGGKAKKVTVVWQSNTTNGRTLDIYGKNSAYSAATDLYSTSTQGTKLGSIVKGTSTTLTITGDYKYIGLRSNSGAMYLTSISIDWATTTDGGTITTTYYHSTPDCGAPCTDAVTISKGTETNGIFTLSTTGQQSTCDGPVTVTLSNIQPATGYQFSEITQSGVDAAKVTIDNNNKTVTYAKNTTGTSTINVTFTPAIYTITYKDQGGTDFSGTHAEGHPTTHTYNTATTLKSATKDHYTFDGWYKEDDCSGTAVTTLGATEYTNDITLYAKWTAKTYTITLDANGGIFTKDGNTSTTISVSYVYGTYATYDAAKSISAYLEEEGITISREGYQLNEKWQSQGAPWTKIYTATGDRIIQAQWTKVDCRWIETDIANITSEDEVVVVITTKDGNTWALPHSGGTKTQPTVIPVTVNGNSLSGKIDNAIKWNIANDVGNLTFYPNGTMETWLYCNNDNNGVRVGTNGDKIYTIDASNGYLKHTATNRYVGVYSNQDWRCYTSINNSNIPGQTLKFYKRVCVDESNPWCTVTFNAGSGSCDTESLTVTKEDSIILPTATPSEECQDEWTFVGWATTSVTETTTAPTLLLADSIYNPSDSCTLYAVYSKEETEEGGGALEEVSNKYTFSNYTAGTQYAVNEQHKLDENVTLTTTQCHFTSELRIYSSNDHNGYVVSNELPGRVVSIGINAGNKVDNVLVYGSTDGNTWTKVGSIAVTSTSYNDYTLDFGEKNYTYFKLDVEGANQVRLKSITITWESIGAGGGSTITYNSNPSCEVCDKIITISKGEETNGNTFTLSQIDDIKTCDGEVEVVVTPTSAEHYSVSKVTATTPTIGGTSTITDNGDGTWTVTYAQNSQGESTINVTFVEDAKATITLSELGVETTDNTTYYVDETYTLPSTSSQSCEGKELVGWSTVKVAETDIKPTENYYELGAEVILDAEQTFHAVFATLTSGGEGTITKLTADDDFYYGDKIILIAENTRYGLYRSSSSNYVNYWTTSNNDGVPTAAEIEADSKRFIEISEGTTEGTIKLGNVTDGYLYNPSSTDLSISTTNASDWELIAWTDNTFTFKAIQYLSCRTDLSGTNANKWRGAGGSCNCETGENCSGTIYYNIYRYTSGSSYTAYTTSCVPTYSITYDFAGGTGSHCSNTTVPQGESYTICEDEPTKTGYTFLHWSDGTTTYAAGVTITPTSNITLTAVWQINTYTVIWSNNGATDEVTYNHGESLVVPTDIASCDGVKEFVGWTTQSGYYHATEKPDDLFTTKTGVVTATATYYAVFATPGGTGSTNATTTLDFSAQGYNNEQAISSLTVNGVIATLAKGTNADNGPKYYNSGTAVRTYGGNTIKLSANNITAVTFTFGSGETHSNTISANTGSWEEPNWTGDAVNELVFTISGSSGHRRIQSIAVTHTTGSTAAHTDYTTICRQVESIEVTNPKTEFFITDDFTIGAGKVMAQFGEGESQDVTSLATFSGYNMNEVGTYTVTVTYMGATATYNIEVKPLDNAWVLTWNVSGKTNTGLRPRQVTKGSAIGTLPVPEVPAACEGKSFIGWTESNTVPSDGVGIVYITSETVPTDNTTYYAVFATVNNFSIQKPITDITSGSKVVIVAVASMDDTGSTGKAISSRTISITSQGVIGLDGDEVSIFDETINTPHSTCIWTLKKNGATVTFEQGDKYIKATDSGYRKLVLDANADYWTLIPVAGKDKTYHMQSGNTSHYVEWFDHTDSKYDEGERYIGFVPYTSANNLGDFDMQFFVVAGDGADITDYTTGCTEYTITYYGFRGGYSTSTSSDGIIILPVNSAHTVPDCGDVVKDHTDLGREFLNLWMTEPHGGHTFKPGDTFILTQDTTLYAQWKLETTADVTLPTGVEDLKGTDVYVYGGNTLTMVPDVVTINSLVLKGGLQPDGSYQMPSVWIPDGATLVRNNNKIYLDLAINAKNWYPFAVPFATKNDQYLDYLDPVLRDASTYGKHFAIKTYDGANRAKVGEDRANNWKQLLRHTGGTTSYLEPGVGYIISAMTKSGVDTATIRIPMTVPNTWFENGEQIAVGSTSRNTIAVTAHTGAAATEHRRHAGWNFIASPYLSEFAGNKVDNGGTYINGWINIANQYNYEDTEIPYVTIPVYDFTYYEQKKVSEATLSPEWSFFVQIAESGTINFVEEGRQTAPAGIAARTQEERPVKMDIDINLTDGRNTDQMGIIVCEKYSDAYEIGRDLEKMFGSAYNLVVYSLMNDNTPLAYQAVPLLNETHPIPIGYRAPEQGEYTFSLKQNTSSVDLLNEQYEQLVLVDYETGTLTNLLNSDYTFSSERTQSNSRFALYAVPRQDSSTELPNISDEEDAIRKIFYNGHLFIIRNGNVYNGNGQIVK